MSDSSESHDLLVAQARALVSGETDSVAIAANLSALLYSSLENVNWAGFYFFRNDELIVGPFQGMPACVHIAMGKGVCGTAAKEQRSLIVDDVHAFAGHIACDGASASEVVVPILQGERLLGVIDVDSPLPARFSAADQRMLEAVATIYVEATTGASA